MKVEELIQELKKCNPDADVEIIDIEGNYSCDLLQVEDNEDRVYFYVEIWCLKIYIFF